MIRILVNINLVFLFGFITTGFAQTAQKLQYKLVESVQLPEQITTLNFIKVGGVDETTQLVVTDDKSLRWRNEVQPAIQLPDGYMKTIFSKTANYFCLVSLQATDSDDTKQIIIDIFSKEDGRLYTVKQSRHFDDSMPLIAISDSDGSLILGQNFNGTLYFFSPVGELVKQVELFEDSEYDLERALDFDLDATGSKLAVVAGLRGASPQNSTAPNPSAVPHLFLFSNDGQKLWQQELPELNTSAVRISDDGRYVVANSYSVDIRGNVKKRSTVFRDRDEILSSDILFKKADFSADSDFVILADNVEAGAFDLASKKRIWREKITPGAEMITSVKISKNAGVSVLLIAKNEFKSGAFVFTSPRLKILNKTGELQQEISFEGQTFRKPNLELAADGSEIAIGFLNNYEIYRVVK